MYLDNIYMPNILNSFLMIFFSYLALVIQTLIPYQIKASESNKTLETKTIVLPVNEIYIEQRKEIEAEIAEQKQKQKLFELQNELNQLRKQNEIYLNDNNQNKPENDEQK